MDTPISACADGWRALPVPTRDRVWQAARAERPAPDAAIAVAAVAYGRHVRRRQTLIGYALVAAMAGLLALATRIGGPVPALPGLTVTGTQHDLVLAAFVAAVGALVAFVQASLGVRRLIGANLPMAAGNETGRDRLRVGRRFPRATEVAEVAAVAVGFAGLPLMHNYVTLAVLAVATVLLAVAGPGALDPHSATLDEDGIHLPRWRVTVPWSSVRGAELAGDRLVRFRVSGGYRTTGRLPTAWRRRIDGRMAGGFTLACAEPELVVGTARRHRR